MPLVAVAISQLGLNIALQVIVLATVGPGRETDAFIAAQTVPLVLFSIVAVSLQSVWQPRFTVLTQDFGAFTRAQRQAHTQAVVVHGGTTLALCLTCPIWFPATFSTFSADQLRLAYRMLWLVAIGNWISGHALIYTAALRARHRFLLADSVGLLWSLAATLAAIVIIPRGGVEAAAWLVLARSGINCAHLFLLSGRSLPNLLFVGDGQRMWSQLRPLMAGSALYKTSPLVDRYWAAQAGPGGLTLYNLAALGISSGAMVLERTMIGPFSVRAATLIAAKDHAALLNLWRQSLRRITVLTVVTAGLIVGSQPWWQVALGSIGLTARMSSDLWLVSLLLLGHLHVAASGAVCVAIFYAYGDTRTPALIGLVGFAVGLALKYVGFRLGQLPGLAAATSLMFLLNLAMFSASLYRKRYLMASSSRAESHEQ